MRPEPPSRRTNARTRPLLAALVVVLACGWGDSANAGALITTRSVTYEAHEHAQFCKCATCRGAACCCGPRHAKPVAQPTPAPAAPTDNAPNPCVMASPCGDPFVPAAAPVDPIAKAAALASRLRSRAAEAGALTSFPPRCILPMRITSRLDDPPEGRSAR